MEETLHRRQMFANGEQETHGFFVACYLVTIEKWKRIICSYVTKGELITDFKN